MPMPTAMKGAVHRILVIEDQPELRAAMGRALGALPGAAPTLVGSVREATEALSSEPPGLVVCDMNLPDGSGLDVLRALDELALHVPVLILSAWLDRYEGRLPDNPLLSVHHKPVTLRKLQSLALGAMAQSVADRGPFQPLDYVELAALGGFSLRVERVLRDDWEPDAHLDIFEGELWSAAFGRLRGLSAARALVALDGAEIRACPLERAPGPREMNVAISALTTPVPIEFASSQPLGCQAATPPAVLPLAPTPPGGSSGPRRVAPTSFTLTPAPTPAAKPETPPSGAASAQPHRGAIAALLTGFAMSVLAAGWLVFR